MAFGEGNSLHNIMIVKTEGVYKTPDFKLVLKDGGGPCNYVS